MSFFDKKNAIDAASKKRAGGKAAAGMAAAAVAAGGAVLASEAGAAALANVASYALNDDGSVTVTYADGSTATYAAGSFEIIGDQVHVGSNAVLIAGGVAGLAALAALALSSAEASAAAATAGADVRGLKFASDDGDDADAGDDAGDDADAGDDDASTGTFTPAGNTGSDDPATQISPVLTGTSTTFDMTGVSVDDSVSEVAISQTVTAVTLVGDDSISLVDLDSAGAGPVVTVSGLDGGDRVEVEDDITYNLVMESGAEQDDPVIVSIESADLTGLGVDGGAEGLRIEATGDDASSVAMLTDTTAGTLERLELAGDQSLTILNHTGATSLSAIDATEATGGVTIGTFDATTGALTAAASATPALADYDGSGAADVLGLTSVAANANFDLGAGDDVFDIAASGIPGPLTVIAGDGADLVDLGLHATFATATNAVVVDLGAADGAADEIIVNDVTANNALTIQNFEAGIDTLDLSEDGLATTVGGSAVITVAVVDGDTSSSDVELTAGLNIISDALAVTDLSVAADVIQALSADYDFEADLDAVYVMVNNGTDSALYHITDGAAADADVDASDTALLVAEFDGVSDMSALAGSSTSFVEFA